MRIGPNYEAIELAGARANAAVHERVKNAARAICGRKATGARVLPKLSTMDFDPDEPDIHFCRSCLRLARLRPGAIIEDTSN